MAPQQVIIHEPHKRAVKRPGHRHFVFFKISRFRALATDIPMNSGRMAITKMYILSVAK